MTAVASRSADAAAALAARLPGTPAVAPAAACAAADIVFLTVPDDALAAACAALPWRPGQLAVHCSGATELTALDAARAAGAGVAGFHPLQIFSDPGRGLARLRGSSVAIEVGGGGPPSAADWLGALAQDLGLEVITVPAGARALYHAAASHSASFLLSLLQESLDLWARFGVGPQAALAALLPLARGTLDAAAAAGPAGALSGPLSRGDAGVVRRHLQALHALGGDHGDFYRVLARRQLRLAHDAGRLDPATLAALAAVLDGPGRGP
ncbi:DUF2520 domain-containing protein [Aquabacterium sp. J223]|uniref:DUF2520 domain-containing protein n=1 Tax=Aquabacterium sp. J223 TaxID=2898431 RepID=UPI0021ADB057|nr:DUF2520 domain-containing protein [Aquabacterium sp. J223]UUX93963.1 DUF2520 domain-containing protein [Aquabacterium sp. J223]